MSEQMEFPETFEKFAKEYGFKDDKEVYTNGSELIPVFRVKQWLDHLEQEPVLDKIRDKIEPTRKMYLEMNDIDWLNGCDYVLQIIDKYKA